MTQRALAYEDISAGHWTPTPVSEWIRVDPIFNLFYVTSGAGYVGDTFEVLLDRLNWPQAGPQTLTVRLRKADSGTLGVTIKLMQGSTLIKAMNVQPTETFTDYTLTLSAAERQLITDYSDLRVRVTAGYTVQVDCCLNNLPEILQGVISNKSGFATQLPDKITFAPGGGQQWWWEAGTSLPCTGGREANLSLACAGTSVLDMQLRSGALILVPFPFPTPGVGASCSPVSLTYSVNFTSGVCGFGSYTLTVTE